MSFSLGPLRLELINRYHQQRPCVCMRGHPCACSQRSTTNHTLTTIQCTLTEIDRPVVHAHNKYQASQCMLAEIDRLVAHAHNKYQASQCMLTVNGKSMDACSQRLIDQLCMLTINTGQMNACSQQILNLRMHAHCEWDMEEASCKS